MKQVFIVDYGLGNIQSVRNAMVILGCHATVCNKAEELALAGYIILPGVGAFGDGINNLKAASFDKAIVAAIGRGAKLLGICLGMQLLFDKSYEFGEYQGLHLLSGEVKRIDAESFDLRIPHIGWNDTALKKEDALFAGMPNPSCFYYVNSYACVPDNPAHILGEYEYGRKYVGIVRDKNIVGVQFHPEKSQKYGMQLLKNFLAL